MGIVYKVGCPRILFFFLNMFHTYNKPAVSQDVKM